MNMITGFFIMGKHSNFDAPLFHIQRQVLTLLQVFRYYNIMLAKSDEFRLNTGIVLDRDRQVKHNFGKAEKCAYCVTKFR